MSIYSGFATRNQENYYDQILYNLISTLLVRISKFYSGEEVEENSFLKIIVNHEKTLKKLEKRKVSSAQITQYLEPKYAELLQTFINQTKADYYPPEKTTGRKLNRTLSVLDRQFHELRNANQKHVTLDQTDHRDTHSLMKIDERVKKSKKKSKSHKKNSIKTIKSHLDVWQFKNEKKMPQLPSLHANIEQNLLTHSKFNTKINFSQANSREMSDAQQFSVRLNQKPEALKTLNRPPKFRAKMYFKQS